MCYCSSLVRIRDGTKVRARDGNPLISFSRDLLVFCERKSDLLVKKEKIAPVTPFS